MRKSLLFLLFLVSGFTVSLVITSFSLSPAESAVAFMKKKKDKKKKKKKSKKKKAPKSDCDANRLTRTSSDSLILKKYVTLYKDLGGTCYIRKLQEMGDLEKTGEGQYTVYLGKSKSPDDRMAWTTFMYCPIGKPDGSVALVQASGDTVQYCTYKNEMKHGFMYWLKPRYGIVAMFEFINDEKPAAIVPDYDASAPDPGAETDGNRTDE